MKTHPRTSKRHWTKGRDPEVEAARISKKFGVEIRHHPFGDYVGTASDGTVVFLGSLGSEEVLEAYLTDYPTPDHW